ncbi:MAG: hypothetical protein L3J21_04650, partial [Devosiaceae bacterium]|nr:hypothetical protein [Devosiaceae bacterium]
CVALQLLRKGADVTLVDNGENASSIIAAGIMNPLVFRRMTKGWRVDDFVPSLIDFYTSVEEETTTSFFQNLPIRRLFSTEHERGLWIKKQDREDFKDYMTPLEESDDNYNKCINQFGSGRIKNAFTITPSIFLDSAKNIIREKGKIIEATFNYVDLKGTSYHGSQYDDIVFCEGYLGMNNPWFSFLPINPTKGEVLTIHSDKLPENESLNLKCFNLPMGKKQFKIG